MKLFQLLAFCVFLAFGFLMSCNKDECDDTNIFTYNSENGKCENCDGEEGFNTFDIQAIRATGNAECLDLFKQRLVFLLDTAMIENFQEFGDNILEGYNFKGSKLDSCQLFFNNIRDADFSGTDLSTLQFGYALIEGLVDEYTIIPGSCAAVENDSLYCVQ